MLDELAKIREDALKRLENIKSEEELSELNTSVLGRNGALTAILRTMGKLSAERRAQLGKAANEVKQSIAEALEARKAMLTHLQSKSALKTKPLTLPFRALSSCRPASSTRLPRYIAKSAMRLLDWASQPLKGPKSNMTILTSQS